MDDTGNDHEPLVSPRQQISTDIHTRTREQVSPARASRNNTQWDTGCDPEAQQKISTDSKVKADRKVIACVTCNRCYTNRVNMLRHRRLKHGYNPQHSAKKDRPFACVECNKSYTTKEHLRIHNRRKHGGPPPRTKVTLDQKLFSCDTCNAKYTSSMNLRRHKRLKHTFGGAVQERTLATEKRSETYVCNDCSKAYLSKISLNCHRRKKHSLQSVAMRYTRRSFTDDQKIFICDVCSKRFISSKSLRIHKHLKHSLVVRQCENKLKCSFESCTFMCRRMVQLVEHLCVEHNQTLKFEKITFSTMTEFQDWRRTVEEDTPCQFNKCQTFNDQQGHRIYYYCSRSGYKKKHHVEIRRRSTKRQGSCKIERTCPAHIFVCRNVDEGTVNVRCVLKHLCFSSLPSQLPHLRLSKSDKERIAAKLAQKNNHLGIRGMKCSGIRMEKEVDKELKSTVADVPARYCSGIGIEHEVSEVKEDQVIDGNVPAVESICIEHHQEFLESNKFLESTAAVLKQYRAESFLCDMIILVDDGELPAHSAILCASSPVVKSSLGLLTYLTAPYRIQFPNVKKAVMDLVLDAIYTGQIDLDVVNRVKIRQLLDILKIDIAKLVKRSVTVNKNPSIAELNSSGINVDTPVQTLDKADDIPLNYGSIDDLDSMSSSAFQIDELKQVDTANTECENNATSLNTECKIRSTDNLMSDSRADKIVAILNELTDRYWSTGLCPCHSCYANPPKAEPFSSHAKLFHCDYCLYRTREISNLYAHIRRRCKLYEHSYTKPAPHNSEFKPRDYRSDGRFPCDLCSEVFDDEPAVLDHVLVHRRQKEFRCEICDKMFQREAFKQHRRSHEILSATPDICHVCGQPFTGRPALNKHLIKAHADVKYDSASQSRKCSHCTMVFAKPRTLTSHMERAHGIVYHDFDGGEQVLRLRYVCERCGAMFNSGGTFAKHKRVCDV